MDYNIYNNNPIKNKTLKIGAVFLAVSFAISMVSMPSMVGDTNAQNNQDDSPPACGPGFTLQQGVCISDDPPTEDCSYLGQDVILEDDKCVKFEDPDKKCPAGSTQHSNKCLEEGPPIQISCKQIDWMAPDGPTIIVEGKCVQKVLEFPNKNRDICVENFGKFNRSEMTCTYPPNPPECSDEYPIQYNNKCFKEVPK
ncbi:MAG: hypothetical protein R3321_09465 [Nitrososphaeraceae archaeon]|nr:hypothetical protein [Nitrososphaeraceae archaeon]